MPNKLTPGSNLMWESSRMMIPQHKEAALRQSREFQKQTRPELTDEEREELFGRLKAAKAHTLEVTINVYGEFENRQVRGMVTGLDPRLHLVKVEANYDWQLIDFVDVIKVELDNEYFESNEKLL